jgi:hypothetical protein
MHVCMYACVYIDIGSASFASIPIKGHPAHTTASTRHGMYVCIYVCSYNICVCVCPNVHTYICTYIYRYRVSLSSVHPNQWAPRTYCSFDQASVCMYVCMHACMYVCRSMGTPHILQLRPGICMYVCMYVNHTYTFTLTYMCAN